MSGLLVLWGIMGVIVAIVAASKGRNPVGWFFYGLLIWPIALTHIIVSKPVAAAAAQTSISDRPLVGFERADSHMFQGPLRLPCPFCAEAILPAAKLCPACKSALPPDWSAAKLAAGPRAKPEPLSSLGEERLFYPLPGESQAAMQARKQAAANDPAWLIAAQPLKLEGRGTHLPRKGESQGEFEARLRWEGVLPPE